MWLLLETVEYVPLRTGRPGGGGGGWLGTGGIVGPICNARLGGEAAAGSWVRPGMTPVEFGTGL